MKWRLVLNPLFWWRDIQRRIDLMILWPACKRESDYVEVARGAFLYHMAHDSAWTTDFTFDELIAFVETLV